MKIVYSWLKDFIDLEMSPEELGNALTMSGLEAVSVEHRKIPHGVVVGLVVEMRPHPNADRLSVCKVAAGDAEPFTIVCGAPNVAPGMHVPLATIGTKLTSEFTIKKSKLRGIESYGMLCSEKELGISDDDRGLMVLANTTLPGKPLSDYYPDDAIIEIELTPDRGYCLSMIGVAREVAARYGKTIRNTAKIPPESSDDAITAAINVSIEEPLRCPRYAGRLIRNVTIAPSPRWLQNRLSLAGIRSINNVVDITNYMLLHFGQPMHAFDYAQIGKRSIVVKKAGRECTFTTLDGIERTLAVDDLLITDGTGSLALAGIMGGAGSEITEKTNDVFLECAFFEPTGIRKTARRLGLSTDSSYRFERGVDPEKGLIDALDTAAYYIADIAGGVVAKGRIDVFPKALERSVIILRPEKVSALLGVALSPETIIRHLESLGIECRNNSDGTLSCLPPLYRHDLVIAEDLIEEVGRLYGYDNIPAAETMALPLYRRNTPTETITDLLRNAMAFSGMHEAITNSMISEKKCLLVAPEKKPVFILNPLTPDMACMRTSLLSSLLDITAYNCNRKNGDNRFFEVGKRFEMLSSDEYLERTVCAVLIEGNFRRATWNSPAEPVSFYILKGILETFTCHAGLSECRFALSEKYPSCFGPEVTEVFIGETIHGYAGMIDKKVLESFTIATSVCYAELDITEFIMSNDLPKKKYRPLPRFPALERDFSFIMDEGTSSSAIIDTVLPLSSLIESVTPFDVFRGEKLGTRKKSIAFNLKFRSNEKTLTDHDVSDLCEKIVSTVADQCKATLRI